MTHHSKQNHDYLRRVIGDLSRFLESAWCRKGEDCPTFYSKRNDFNGLSKFESILDTWSSLQKYSESQTRRW